MDPTAGPGDLRPRHLERPPGERYRIADAVILERPQLGRATLLGIAVALLAALAGALLRSILDVTSGLLVLAVGGGWLVGAAVRRGAWGGMAHRPSTAPAVMGVVLGVGMWLAALLLSWVVAMVILPASERSLLDRLASTPFLDWLWPQVGLADVLGLALAAVFGWVGARSVGIAPA